MVALTVAELVDVITAVGAVVAAVGVALARTWSRRDRQAVIRGVESSTGRALEALRAIAETRRDVADDALFKASEADDELALAEDEGERPPPW